MLRYNLLKSPVNFYFINNIILLPIYLLHEAIHYDIILDRRTSVAKVLFNPQQIIPAFDVFLGERDLVFSAIAIGGAARFPFLE